MADCIFCDIGARKTETPILFDDDRCFVIQDINPVAPTHVLIIPYTHMASLAYVGPGQESNIGHLFAVAEEIARRQAITLSGFRLVLNQGPDSGQSVAHLHLHLLGGKPLHALG